MCLDDVGSSSSQPWQVFLTRPLNALNVFLQPSKDCVQKTLKRLEEKVAGRVLNQVLYSLGAADCVLQQRTATALARLVKEHDLKLVFVDRRGLDILLHMLTDHSSPPGNQREAAGTCSCCTASHQHVSGPPLLLPVYCHIKRAAPWLQSGSSSQQAACICLHASNTAIQAP